MNRLKDRPLITYGVIFLLAFLLGKCSDPKPDVIHRTRTEYKTRTDTLIQYVKRDTVIWRTDTIRVPEPVEVRTSPVGMTTRLYQDTVSLEGLKLRYSTLVQGRLLDQDFHYMITEPVMVKTITIKEPVIVKERKRWGLGVYAGYDLINQNPSLGVSVQYNLLQW